MEPVDSEGIEESIFRCKGKIPSDAPYFKICVCIRILPSILISEHGADVADRTNQVLILSLLGQEVLSEATISYMWTGAISDFIVSFSL